MINSVSWIHAELDPIDCRWGVLPNLGVLPVLGSLGVFLPVGANKKHVSFQVPRRTEPQEPLAEWTQVAETRQYCPSHLDIDRPLRMETRFIWRIGEKLNGSILVGRTYFTGDWGVHWGYGVLTHGHMENWGNSGFGDRVGRTMFAFVPCSWQREGQLSSECVRLGRAPEELTLAKQLTVPGFCKLLAFF